MKTRQRIIANVACSAALLCNSLAGFAQGQEPSKGERLIVIERTDQVKAEGQELAYPPIALAAQDITIYGEAVGQAGVGFNFISSEMSFDSRVVKGAPFSAEAVTESIQSLADGNRIVRKSTTAIHRDGEGRTRREQTLIAVGPMTASGQPRTTIFINDPVGNQNYMLDPQELTARKVMGMNRNFFRSAPPPPPGAPPANVIEFTAARQMRGSGGAFQASAVKRVQPAYPDVAKAAKAQGSVQVQVTVAEDGRVTGAEVISGHPLLRESALNAARQWEFKPAEAKVQGIVTFNFTLQGESGATPPVDQAVLLAPGRAKSESLGKQTIEGLEAEGTRSVMTIPAGQIGNERPIEIVSERWYSPELQTVILSRHSDPRFGENVYRLVNINRSEPAPALFQVPADYTLKDDERNMELKMKRRPGEQ